ncbi:Trm112 family protein [Histophilus somni]|uniref:Trm112 family protein n=1 Tax=Histophilus somni TaxID=731 RepID=UPI00094AFFF1|nr:Trm112 family protein [Histophilus somni]
MNGRLLEIVACPICQGRLKYDSENEQLICHLDHIAYPIKQGIPILLSDQAISLSTSLTNPEQQNQ